MRMGIGLGVGINRSNYAQGIFNAYSARVVADGGVVEGGACVDAVSSLLQSASLLLIPSGYKANKLYSEIPTNGNGDLTWTRASTALRTNSSGLLESMGSGVPRLSYMYGSCPSVLLEPQRTNLALYSEQFDNASWSKINTSVTSNQTTAPDGNTTADLLIANTTLDQHRIDQTPASSAGTQTLSIYAKAGGYGFVGLRIGLGGALFNLSTGATSLVGVGYTASTELASNGFYRCILTKSVGLVNDVGRVNISDGTAIAPNFSGNNTDGVFLWGAQLELGAYATTIIPTTSATATRVADSFSRNNIYTNGLISASGGTWFVELRGNVGYSRDTSGGGFGINTNVNSLTNDNGFTFRNSGAANSRLGIYKVISSTNTLLYTTTSDTTKIAIKWNGSTADVFVNGTKQVSATAFTSTLLEFFNSSTLDVPKFIQQMALSPEPLTDTKLIELTTL